MDEKLKDEPSVSKWKKMKEEVLKEIEIWSFATHVHGVFSLYKARNLSRFIWATAMVACVIYSYINLFESIDIYLKFAADIDFKMVAVSHIDFPAITICNMQPFNVLPSEQNRDYIKNLIHTMNVSLPQKTNETITFNGAYQLLENASTFVRAYVTADTNLSVTRKIYLGFTINQMLVSCYFNNRPCNSTHFRYFRDNQYGNCYIFNDLYKDAYRNSTRNSRKVNKPGPKTGLSLELFTGVKNVDDLFLTSSGLIMAIHQRGVLPVLKYEGFTVANAMATSVAITLNELKRLSRPARPCRKDPQTLLATDSKYHQMTLEISFYHQRLCFEICFQYEFVIPECKCADPSVPIIEKRQSICYTLASLDCVERQRHMHGIDEKLTDYCGNRCPLECDSVDYATSISFADFPSYSYTRILANKSNFTSKFAHSRYLDQEKWRNSINNNSQLSLLDSKDRNNTLVQDKVIGQITDSIVLLQVYFDEILYASINEKQKVSIETFIGLLGGINGLLMGMSFLAICEVLDMILNVVLVVFRYIFKKNFNYVYSSKQS